MISLTYDTSNTNTVAIFNNNSYYLSSIQILQQPIHTFNGNPVDSEIVIVHNQVNSNKVLNVYIPISQTFGSKKSSDILNIITTMSNAAPKKDTSTAQGIPTFSVFNILPKTQFYTYTTTDNNTSFIVFDLNGAMMLSSSTIAILKSILSVPYYSPIYPAMTKITINKKGPRSSSGPSISSDGSTDNDIYIDCQQVGTEEVKEVLVSKNNVTHMFSSYFSPDTTLNIISITFVSLFFLLILFILGYYFSDSFKEKINSYLGKFQMKT
jgi:hypothetical protein